MRGAIKISKCDGFSLIEVMVTLGVTSIISLSLASLISSTKQDLQRQSRIIDVDRAHAHNTSLAKKLNTLRADPGVVGTNPTLRACFSKKSSSGCAAFNEATATHSLAIPPNSDFCSTASSPTECKAASTILTRRACSATRCTHVEVTVTTTAASGLASKPRVTRFNVPAIVLVENAQINFTCASGGYITGIDNVTGEAICGTAVPYTPAVSTCTGSGNAPMANFGSAGACQSVPTVNCTTFGISGTGVSTNCKTAGT